jgi:hypothetical protein
MLKMHLISAFWLADVLSDQNKFGEAEPIYQLVPEGGRGYSRGNMEVRNGFTTSLRIY